MQPDIRSQLLAGTYQPQPVKRVEIPKPDCGVRKLGVPCVVNRLIQKALLQVLQRRWDPTFSEHSYGFRPGRSAHQVVALAQRYVAEGYSVADTGPGILEQERTRIFDQFHQVDSSLTKTKGGTGPGLAIAKADRRDARRAHLG
jgi:retron-type reverse transcriptase